MAYLLTLLLEMAAVVVVSVGLGMVAGQGGMFAVCWAGVAGVGAYVAALLGQTLPCHSELQLIAAATAGGLFGMVLTAGADWRSPERFILVSFAAQIGFEAVVNNWTAVTGGALGIVGIRRPCLAGLRIDSGPLMLAMFAGLALTVVLAAEVLCRAPFGRALRMGRDDPQLTESLGTALPRLRNEALVFGAMIAGAGGAMYAWHIGYIDPRTFSMNESLFFLSILVLGGSGRPLPTAMAAVTLVMLPEALRSVGIASSSTASVRELLYGLVLIAMVLFRRGDE